MANAAVVPTKHRAIMRWSSRIARSTSGFTGRDTLTLKINSVFDVDGTGHQPLGYDQISPLYNRYRVLSVGYEVTCVNATQDDASQQTLIFCVQPHANVIAATTIQELNEQPLSSRIKVTAPSITTNTGTSTGAAGANNVSFSGNVKLNQLEGVTPAQYLADDRYQAATNASPPEIFNLSLITENLTGVVSHSFLVFVRLTFVVDFFDPKQLPVS